MSLTKALARHAKLAFRRVQPGAELIKRSYKLSKGNCLDPSLEKITEWLMVPFSLWPVDLIGVAEHVIQLAESGKHSSVEIQKLIEMLGEPPKTKTCDSIIAHEHFVKGGNYESLIKAQCKFDAKEKLHLDDAEFIADWTWIKKHFDLNKHQDKNGIIRRRMVSERNFHPLDWNFSWRSKSDKFFNVFDTFCYKWILYGMEKDKPLLQKLSVNITPYGTMIVIPRYWSFDCHRDLKWKAITQLHHSRGVPRQGAKLAANFVQRRGQAKVAKRYYLEATGLGKKGEVRTAWVMEKIGMHPATDPKQLRRLLKLG